MKNVLSIGAISLLCGLLNGCSHLNREARFTKVSDMNHGLTLQFAGRKPGWISIGNQGSRWESGCRIEDGWSGKARGSGFIHFDIVDNSLPLWPNPAFGEKVQLLRASEIELDDGVAEIGKLKLRKGIFPIVVSIAREEHP